MKADLWYYRGINAHQLGSIGHEYGGAFGNGERDATETGVRACYRAQRAAMVAGDANALAETLADGFTLTHMTGYVQSRDEWLDHVASGAMTYHSMSDVTLDVVDTDTRTPTLTVRTRTDATIWGSRGLWPLQLEISFVYDGSQWRAVRTVASTW